MKFEDKKFFIMLVVSTLFLIPSFALLSYSQFDDTLAEDTLFEEISTNNTFSTWSRELAQNQSESESNNDEDEN